MSDRPAPRFSSLRRAGFLAAAALLSVFLTGCVFSVGGDDILATPTSSPLLSASYAKRSSNVATANARQARSMVETLPVCVEASGDIETAREIAAGIDDLAGEATAAAERAVAANDAVVETAGMRAIVDRDMTPALGEFARLGAELSDLPRRYLTGTGVDRGEDRPIGDIVADYNRISADLAALGGRLMGMSDRVGDFLRGPESAAMRAAMPGRDFVALERDIATRVEAFAAQANFLESFLVFEGDGSIPFSALDWRKREAVARYASRIDAVLSAGEQLHTYLLGGSAPGSVSAFMSATSRSASDRAAEEYTRAADALDQSTDKLDSLRELAETIRETCGSRDVFRDLLSPPDWMSTDWLISSP